MLEVDEVPHQVRADLQVGVFAHGAGQRGCVAEHGRQARQGNSDRAAGHQRYQQPVAATPPASAGESHYIAAQHDQQGDQGVEADVSGRPG